MEHLWRTAGVVIVVVALVALATMATWFLGQQTIGPILIENQSDTPYLAQVAGVKDGAVAPWETVTLPAGSRTTIGDSGHEASVFVHAVEIVGLDCLSIASCEVDTDTEGGRIVITNGPKLQRIPGGRPPEGETARLTTQCPHS